MGIEERIEVTGADESKRRLDSVADAQSRVGKTAEEAGQGAEHSAGSFKRFGDVLDVGLTRVLSLAGGMLGANGLNAALELNAEDAKRAADALMEYVDAMAATIALTKDPKFLEIATAASIESGKPIKEIGKSTFAITSSLGKDPSIAESVIREAVEISKTEPDVNFDRIVELLVRLRKIGGPTFSLQQAQNFAIKTEEFATANIGDLAAQIPGLLGVGAPAGLGFADIGALFGIATGQLSPEVASTGIKNIISGLANPKSSEAQALLKSIGISADAPLTDKLRALAARNAASPLSVKESQSVAGEGPGAAVLPILLSQFADFERNRSAIAAAIEPGAPDLGQRGLQALRGIIPGFRAVEGVRSAEQNLERTRRESPAAEADFLAQQLRAHMEAVLNEAGATPSQKYWAGVTFNKVYNATGDPVTALTLAFPNVVARGVSFGGSSAQAAEEIVNAVIAGQPPGNVVGRITGQPQANVTNVTNINIGTQYNERDETIYAPVPLDRGE